MQSAEIKEELKEWPEEHDSCEMQELSGYLYEHTSVSPYASAEITIKDILQFSCGNGDSTKRVGHAGD